MKHRQRHIKHKLRSLKPKKNIFKMPLFWIALLLFVIVIIVAYCVLFWSKFQITNINISGNKKIGNQEIENLAWSDINQNLFSKRIFIIDTKKIEKDILNKFPVIETVQVQKKWPQGIVLTIKERVPFAIFCGTESFEKCFFVDENGIVFEQIENIPKDMFVVNYKNNTEILLGNNTINKDIIADIIKIEKNLKNNFQINIKKVLAENPLVITTNEGWQIYFDTTSDIDMQITIMNALLKDEISQNARKNLQYIYLQYKDRAYYK